LNFKTWKSVFTNVRFRSWSSKLLGVTAAQVNMFARGLHYVLTVKGNPKFHFQNVSFYSLLEMFSYLCDKLTFKTAQ